MCRELADDLARRPARLLVALSVGTIVVAGAGALAPRQHGGVVLISPIEANSWRDLARRWLSAGTGESVGFLAQQGLEWAQTPPRMLVHTLRSTRYEDIDARVRAAAEAGVPVHVIRGARDPLTPVPLARRLTHGRLVEIPGARHSWPYRDAEGFADAIVSLL